MLTREKFLEIKKGDLIVSVQVDENIYHLGGFQMFKYYALEDCQSNGKVKVSGLENWMEGDDYFFLKFESNNCFYVNPDEQEWREIESLNKIMIKITCPHCAGIFLRDHKSIQHIGKLSIDKVGFILS